MRIRFLKCKLHHRQILMCNIFILKAYISICASTLNILLFVLGKWHSWQEYWISKWENLNLEVYQPWKKHCTAVLVTAPHLWEMGRDRRMTGAYQLLIQLRVYRKTLSQGNNVQRDRSEFLRSSSGFCTHALVHTPALISMHTSHIFIH